MNILGELGLKLPLENPVLIFSLVLFIILFGPLVLNRLKIPPIIGLIIAGAIIGPNGFNLLLRDASIRLFGTVGLLYIMFLAGLEIDMQEFKKNKYRSLLFGMLTFLIPMSIGTIVSLYYLNYSVESSVLLASMFASHTLLAYPIASRFGVTRTRSVNITVGGTIITDTLALLVLAVIVGMVKGDLGAAFWWRLSISFIIFTIVVMWGFPWVARWFFKKENDSISQYIFVLAAVFMAAFLAERAGIEGIIGAFGAGLALNRLIPRTSPLMNRIDFVGNALFIPFFLIGVGMLVDFRVFFKGAHVINVAITMTLVATFCKFAAAWLSKVSFRLTKDEFLMMFGLSNAQAAATLAAVLVGYNIVLGINEDGTTIRLLGEDVLNGTIVMILVTCTISTFTVARASARLAVTTQADEADRKEEVTCRMLVPIANETDVVPLVELAVLISKPRSNERYFALHVVDENASRNGGENDGRKLLDHAVKNAAATDTMFEPIMRHDINIASGIAYTVKEYGITDVVLGVGATGFEHLYGPQAEALISRTNRTIFLYKPVQPLGTLERIVVVVPPKAEFEIGFVRWFDRLRRLVKQTGASVRFHALPSTLERLKELSFRGADPLKATFEELDSWDDLLIVGRHMRENDMLVVVTARRNSLSYDPLFEKLPRLLSRYFKNNGFIVIYPEQLGEEYFDRTNLDPSMGEVLEEGVKTLDQAGRLVKKIFSGNK
jgi:Kef-type K+ transport system membrane component KefB